MFCRRWPPQELLPKADRLAQLLLQNRHVTCVGLTGTLARLEPKIHDIDLIIFHDGILQDGIAPDPCGLKGSDYQDAFPLDVAFVVPDWGLVQSLREASSGTPVDYIFVKEKVLFDCSYLQSLEAKERFKDFYTRVFCDIPLILLRPRERRGILHEVIGLDDIFWFGNDLPGIGLKYNGLRIGHRCADPRCKPRESWEKCRRRIKRRKMHWWHPFMSLIGR